MKNIHFKKLQFLSRELKVLWINLDPLQLVVTKLFENLETTTMSWGIVKDQLVYYE